MADRLLTRRDVSVVALLALLFSFWQAPGRIAPDTKLDLTADPVGFLARAAHLWSPDAPMGQVQNQAYGYFFPHGAFFALGDLLALPGWVTQRLWWALLLTIGFVGLVRLAEALRIGSFASRLLAAAVFATSPRVLTTLGSISSETLPLMLAPWVLVPVVRALDATEPSVRPLWQEAFRSACAVALMGAVNAVATAAAAGVAVAWWLFGLLRREADRARLGRRVTFGAWWALGLALACLWWLVPLLLLSRLSPPFLDFIESARVTTEWSSLTEVLRGTSSWTPFVSSERAAGAVLVSEPAAVVATGILAATGLAGLAMRRMPYRRRLIALLLIGLLVMCLGYPGALGSPIAENYRAFLDGAGAPLRNLHKFDAFVRIPIALGIAHLLARVTVAVPSMRTATDPRPPAKQPVRAQQGLAAALVVVVAAISAGTLAWTGGVAPPGSYRAIPGYWQETADWLADQERDSPAPARALVVPGAPFADQLWGLTRDEPLQPTARTPWAVRDAIPLTPPGAIRAMDAVQRDLAAGRGSPGLAPTLAAQGVGYLVLRADLDPTTSRSARPLLVAQALRDSPGISRAAAFGPPTAPPAQEGFVVDNGLRPEMPAVTVYRVDAATGGTGPRLTPLDEMPRVAGGAESILAVNTARTRAGLPPLGPSLLAGDAEHAGLGRGPGLIVTDTPANRETDFGRVDDHSSAIRSPGDPRLTKNDVADYPVEGQPLVEAQWLLDEEPDRVDVRTSGSAADATQPGRTSPGSSAAAAFDGDPDTAWVSRSLDSAVGQWLAIEFDEPVANLALTVTTAQALGADVSTVLVSTDAGSTVAQGLEPGEPTRIIAPSAPTRRVEIRAIETENGSGGNQFALAEVELSDAATGQPISLRQRVLLPETGGPVLGWYLGPELRERADCVVDAQGRVRCAAALGLASEAPGVFSRALWVPDETAVTPSVVLRPVPGAALNRLLAGSGRIWAEGPSAVTDVRGNASAAVDGDPATAWIAPEPTDSKSRRPTLTVHLPRATEVTGLRLRRADGYPAAPEKVSVDLGDGPQRVDVGRDGDVALNPARTRTVKITVTDTEDLLDTNDLGFTTRAPVGLSEVQVIGPRGPVDSASFDPDRPVVIGCDTDPAGDYGLGLTASGRLIRLQVKTTAGALRDREPVLATPCPGPQLRLREGRQEVAVNPGQAFAVDALELIAPHRPSSPVTASPPIQEWTATQRSVVVEPGGAPRVLSVPESTNPGWRATLNGEVLEPVTVDGWQQGWVIPAGAGGTVALTYPLDGPYRWTLALGLALVAVLFTAACLPLRRRARPGRHRADQHGVDPDTADRPATPTRAVGLVAAASGLGALWLLGGWWGLLIGAATGAATWWFARAGRVIAVFTAMAAATLLLAAGPWHSGMPYTGYDASTQGAALAALGLLIATAILPLRRPPDSPHPPD